MDKLFSKLSNPLSKKSFIVLKNDIVELDGISLRIPFDCEITVVKADADYQFTITKTERLDKFNF